MIKIKLRPLNKHILEKLIMKVFRVIFYMLGIFSAFNFSIVSATNNNSTELESLHEVVQGKLENDTLVIRRTPDRDAYELGFSNPKQVLKTLKLSEASLDKNGHFLIYKVTRPNDNGKKIELYIKFTRTNEGWALISFHGIQNVKERIQEAERKRQAAVLGTIAEAKTFSPRPATILKPRVLKLPKHPSSSNN